MEWCWIGERGENEYSIVTQKILHLTDQTITFIQKLKGIHL